MSVTVGVAGMTHLGLVSASGLGAKGFQTVCVDDDADLIARLNRGDLPVREPGLDAAVAGNGERQVFSSDFAELGACDVVYVAPDVPTDDDGRSDLAGIRDLIGRVIGHLARDAVLAILCQVPPGFTRGIDLPAERLFYQVETLIFGRALERAMEPERYIVGCADPARPLPQAYAAVLEPFGCPVLPMRYESAELAKISINMCLVASIGVANTMAELCENVGADWDEIVPALKLDRRIGQHAYLKPGLGIAGGNLERDLATVLRLSDAHDTDAGIVEAWLANSRYRRDWALETARREVLDKGGDPVIAVWGLAYKENTHSIKNSPSIATLDALSGTRFNLHDPAVADSDDIARLGERAASPLEAVTGADALMVLTPWPAYRDVAPAEIAAAMRGTCVIDPYRLLDADKVAEAGLVHHRLGVAAA